MNQIGTLSEKSIHSLIKDMIQPDKNFQEVKVGRYIADIKQGNNIIEIQTQQFKKLTGKLSYYIQCGYHTTVIYPVVENKYINWIDPSDNEIVERRKSPTKGVIQNIFKELYWIIDCLDNSLIDLQIVTLDAEEYKYLDGYGQNAKKRATKIDKVPTKINNVITIKSKSDLSVLIPTTLQNKSFTIKEFKKESKFSSSWASSGLKLLREHNIIHIVEKKGNAFIYSQ